MKEGAPFDNTPNFRRLVCAGSETDKDVCYATPEASSGSDCPVLCAPLKLRRATGHHPLASLPFSRYGNAWCSVSESWQNGDDVLPGRRPAGCAGLQAPCGIPHGIQSVACHGVVFAVLGAGLAKPAWLARMAYIFAGGEACPLAHTFMQVRLLAEA